jgi:hypothetical protein
MAITRQELRERVKHRLGYPMVKVEICDTQIDDHIIYARDKFIKWAVGNARQEHFLTVMLRGGQSIYDMPPGVTDIISYDDKGVGNSGGINTLFSIENYMYKSGMLDSFFHSGFSLVEYHIALDFLETLDRYITTDYNWKYHRHTNQLEIYPAPPVSGGCLYDTNGLLVDSPGFVLVKTMMIEGATLPTYTPSTSGAYRVDEQFEDALWDKDWIIDYVTAMSKITLGMIRRKFASFSGLGGQGIALDGSELIGEGKEEKADLELTLRNEECYDGYGITFG